MSSAKYAFPDGRGDRAWVILGFVQIVFVVAGYVSFCMSVLRLFAVYMVPYGMAYQKPTRFEILVRCAQDPYFKLGLVAFSISLVLHLLSLRFQPN